MSNVHGKGEGLENVVKGEKYEEMKREPAKKFDKCATKKQRVEFNMFLISAFRFFFFSHLLNCISY